MQIALPPANETPGDLDIPLVDPNDQPLFTSHFAPAGMGPSVFRVGVVDIGYNLLFSSKTVEARVCQRAWDSAQYRYS